MPVQQSICSFIIQSEKDNIWETTRLYLKTQIQIKDPFFSQLWPILQLTDWALSSFRARNFNTTPSS